jgi:hypothetical protein
MESTNEFRARYSGCPFFPPSFFRPCHTSPASLFLARQIGDSLGSIKSVTLISDLQVSVSINDMAVRAAASLLLKGPWRSFNKLVLQNVTL